MFCIVGAMMKGHLFFLAVSVCGAGGEESQFFLCECVRVNEIEYFRGTDANFAPRHKDLSKLHVHSFCVAVTITELLRKEDRNYAVHQYLERLVFQLHLCFRRRIKLSVSNSRNCSHLSFVLMS